MLNTGDNGRAMMPEVTMAPKTKTGKMASARHGSLKQQRSSIRRGKSRSGFRKSR